jgi:hypothetical protein
MEFLQKKCGDGNGVVYYKNENFYGICYSEILELIRYSNLVVVLSDFNAITQVKALIELKDRIKVLYIASSVDERILLERYKDRQEIDYLKEPKKVKKMMNSIERMISVLYSSVEMKYITKIEEVLPLLNEEWNNYVPYFDTIKNRSTNIRLLYNRYIDNIHAIDYVILNFFSLEFMYKQMRNFLINKEPKRKSKYPPIFLVCAAPSSGKATLLSIISDLGAINHKIVVTKKYALRDSRPTTDGRDGMKAIGYSDKFENYIKKENIWEWQFHDDKRDDNCEEKNDEKRMVWYAIDRSEISKNIESGIPQIFISNMKQIEAAKTMYPDNAVILYLHATHESKTKAHIKRKRAIEILKKTIGYDHSNSDDNQLNGDELMQKYASEDLLSLYLESIEYDLKEIKKVQDEYSDYCHLIDHVLLNTGTREDLTEQMINLINEYSKQLE